MAITVKMTPSLLSKEEAREEIYDTICEQFGVSTFWEIACAITDRLRLIQISE